jgi:hypothetical protein
MRTKGKATSTDGSDAFPAVNRSGTLREHGRDKPEMAINTDKTVMLDQDLEAPNPVALNPDDPPRRNCRNRTADGGWKIDSIMECPG